MTFGVCDSSKYIFKQTVETFLHFLSYFLRLCDLGEDSLQATEFHLILTSICYHLSTADEDTALGVADGTIPDSQLSESNCSTSGDYCASWGRLDDSDNTKCWIPDVTDDNQWLQVRGKLKI